MSLKRRLRNSRPAQIKQSLPTRLFAGRLPIAELWNKETRLNSKRLLKKTPGMLRPLEESHGTMVTFKPSTPNAINPAGRVFVLRVAVVCYMLSLAMYLAGFPGHLFAVWIFGTIGCVFLALYLFASNALCLFIRYKLTGRW
jgi:hypothetical protein